MKTSSLLALDAVDTKELNKYRSSEMQRDFTVSKTKYSFIHTVPYLISHYEQKH